MDESSRSLLFDGSRKLVNCNEQVRGSGVVIEEAHEGLANDDVVVDRFGEEWRYPM